MSTIQEEWVRYRDTIYPEGISGTQNRETHQAFFSGALIAMTLTMQLADLPEDKAVIALKKLKEEVHSVGQSIGDAMKARN
jgi:hypothetical protein